MIAPPAAGFRLARYFTVASLAAFLPVAAALLYFELWEGDFFKQVQQEQNAFFAQVQDSFAKQHDAAAHGDLLRVHEAGIVNLTRLFANALWEKDFAPFVAKAQRISVDQCRAIAEVKDAGGKSVQPGEKQACYAGIGKQIMALPEFRALDAKVFDMMKKSTVFKIKVYDLRGITVYSSEHNQIGEDKIGNAGWESALAGKPASGLTHRDKFSAFEGVVQKRDLIEIYLPVLAPGSEKIVAVFELYSDVTPFLEQIKNTSSQIQKLSAENLAKVERAAAANQAKVDANAKLLLAIILGLLALLYVALFLIVRRGQRILDRQDIKRERAEDALSASASRYRAVAQTATDAIITADGAGTIVEWNPAAERMFGYTEAEVIGQPLTLLMPHRYRAGHLDGIRRIQAGGERHVIGKSVELHGLTKTGSEFPLELALSEWETPEGRFSAGIIRDITERKRAEELLRAAAEQFRGLVEQSIAGTYIIQDGTFAYVNPRFAEIRGYGSADELIGRDNISVVAAEDRDIVAENTRRLLAGEILNINYSFTALRKDGSTVEVGAHSALATYRGRPAIIGLMQDISEKKRAEEQINRYIAQLENTFMHAVNIATTLGELRDPYTAGHQRRVAEIAAAIGAELGFDARRVEGLRVAGHLHDIGKISIPTEILAKPGKLSSAEFTLIKGHAQAGYDVLKDVEFPWPVAQVALQHHERMDGSGYPQGLKGEAILLESRIMAVADVIEAMSSHRPYRPGLGIAAALSEIERGRGTLYDANVADACLRLFREKGYTIPA